MSSRLHFISKFPHTRFATSYRNVKIIADVTRHDVAKRTDENAGSVDPAGHVDKKVVISRGSKHRRNIGQNEY